MNLETVCGIIGNHLQQLSPLSSTYALAVLWIRIQWDLDPAGQKWRTKTEKSWSIEIFNKKDKKILCWSPKPQIHIRIWITWNAGSGSRFEESGSTTLVTGLKNSINFVCLLHCRIVRRTTPRVRREEDQMRRIGPACPHPGTGSGIDQKTAAGPGLDRRKRGPGLGRTGSSSGSTGNDQWVSHSLKLGLMWLYQSSTIVWRS